MAAEAAVPEVLAVLEDKVVLEVLVEMVHTMRLLQTTIHNGTSQQVHLETIVLGTKVV